MAIRFVKYLEAAFRAAVFTSVSVVLYCGCRSKTEAIGSTTVVIPSMPNSGASGDTADAAASIRKFPDPIIGSRLTQPPETDEYPRVSTDGQIVAVWTHVFEDPDEEDGPHALYLLGKRVDTDEEIKRLLLEYPLGSPPRETSCRKPRSHRLFDCPAKEVEARKRRAPEFLGAHEWRTLSTFGMTTEEVEWTLESGPRQNLVFSNLKISSFNLTVRVERANGTVLLERKLPPWKVYGTYPRPVPIGRFFVAYIGLDLDLRVMLVALGFNEAAMMGDHNYRFHVMRLPAFE